MLPEIWGTYAWNFIHLVTLDYPKDPTDTDKQNYYNFFNSIQYVLPCAKCRRNMTSHLKKYPLTNDVLSNRDALIKWLIDLHNVVNYYTGKPMLTYADAISQINKLANPSKKTSTNYIFIIIIFVLVVFIIYILRKKN